MTQNEFSIAVGDFDRREPMRAQLYYKALKLIEGGFRRSSSLDPGHMEFRKIPVRDKNI